MASASVGAPGDKADLKDVSDPLCGDLGRRSRTVWEIPLNPARTYLHVCNDPAPDVVPIVLANLGIESGEEILLEGLGGWDNGPGTDVPRNTIAVFSSSPTLLAGSAPHRVPDAIDAGADFVTAPTWFCGGQVTDISEDFRVDSTVVVVPWGATHLFVCGHDSYYVDNTDPNGDYALRITETGLLGVADSAPMGLAALPARPNPFRGSTQIAYTITSPAIISLHVVDASGIHVRTLENARPRRAGTFTVAWDGRHGSGTRCLPVSTSSCSRARVGRPSDASYEPADTWRGRQPSWRVP
jgi:hypothetical protein